MYAADTSSLIAYLAGAEGDDVGQIDAAMAEGQLRLPPPVVSELLSKVGQAGAIDDLLQVVAQLELQPGFWERAGRARRKVRAQGLKAALADALIAQCCIDGDAALITRDTDYRHFAQWCGLKLARP